MKKILFIIAAALIQSAASAQDIFSCKGAQISFFSETALENIEAKSNNGVSILTLSKSDILFTVQIKSFVFDKLLMQEHFNENYMESDKFASATFKGKINEAVDLTKDGDYKVTATGKLTLHGVDQTRTISGTFKVKNGIINLYTQFNIACKDHDIKIPTVVSQKIAEAVQVTLNAEYKAYSSGK